MDIDARTKETAATLLGVALNKPLASASAPNLGSVSRSSAVSQQPAPNSSFSSAPLHQTNHEPQTNDQDHHMAETVIAPTGDVNTVLSMSSIGFGIDSSASTSWGDATEAAVRAIHDAMERSTLRLPMTMPTQHLLQISVHLGVPPKQPGSNEPMIVDVSRLTTILPKAIPVLPIKVVVGGLSMPSDTQGSPAICTAVACIILQSQAPLSVSEKTVPKSHPTITSQAGHQSPWASLESHPSSHSAVSDIPPADIPTSLSASSGAPEVPLPAKVTRKTSIEMLAMISEEIRLASDKKNQGASLNSQLTEEERIATSPDNGDESEMRNGNYNYKKLPPGVTTKNNRRLFVKHTYRDHSIEKPQPDERDLVSSNSRTPNAAFPLKLHETLTQIENDGHGDIIGWMPHGRSFRIHKQKEFAEIILPRYFVMTKKSSFLRQLNLYGFNRFSAGPDQGSYYHEKFLRGLKFLCRRMTRQKVNGNRIRSAGNPDEEPILSSYPSCPPPVIPSIPSSSKRLSYISKEDDETFESMEEDDDGDTDNAVHTAATESQARSNVHLVSFPLKLQRMLDRLEADGNVDTISWLSHGRAFIVHDTDAFVKNLMPLYFNQTKYSSFQRQLHIYSFQRITAGKDEGAYHFPFFQRGRPELCAKMVRTINGEGCGKPCNVSSNPNLYSIEALPRIELGTAIEVPEGNIEADQESDSNSSS